MKILMILPLLFSAMLASCDSTEQTLPEQNMSQDLNVVGSWRLVSVVATAPDGTINTAPFGANPTGELHYSADGRLMLMLSYGGRPRLSVADRVAAPEAERAAAFATHFGYSGRYTVADGQVTHHIEIASYENWVGTELTRILRLEGQRLTLVTPPLTGSGGGASNELVWERI